MIGHQRAVLANLGIDLWIPRALPSQKNAERCLWRDQHSISETDSGSSVAAVKAEMTLDHTAQSQQQHGRVVEPDLQPEQPKTEPSNTLEQTRTDLNFQVNTFQLHAITLEQCSLLIDASSLSVEQQQLWQNIANALPAQKYALSWPFPLLNFQDARGVYSYIQGFIDGLSQGKTVIALGQIPYSQNLTFIQSASLQAMLENPQLKKELWQKMRV